MSWLSATPLRWSVASAILSPLVYVLLGFLVEEPLEWPLVAVFVVMGGLLGWLTWHHDDQSARGSS